MKVRSDPLEGQPIVRLVVTEARPTLGVAAGEVVGYWCEFCHQSDETLTQIVHRTDCDLAGRHGRDAYDDDHPVFDTDEAGELRADTTITIIEWAETDDSREIHHGEPVAFRCDECANLDKHLFEIAHDAACRLAGQEFGPLVG
jgi:hypothetical protein